MTTVLAIDASVSTSVQAVTARLTPDGKIHVVDARQLSSRMDSDSGLEDGPLDGSDPRHPRSPIDLAIDLAEIDEIFATTSVEGSYAAGVTLPFNEQKKVEVVAPLQLQDTLPFDLDGFTVVTTPTGKAARGDYRFLTSLLPDEVIRNTLGLLKRLGVEPRVLTTAASAIAGLARASLPNSDSLPRAFLYITPRSAALAVIRGEELVMVRDFILSEQGEADFLRSLNCTIAKLERDLGEHLSTMKVLAADGVFRLAEQLLTVRPERWDISTLIGNSGLRELTSPAALSARQLLELAVPIGLAAAQLSKPKKGELKLIDFRRGPFAYRHAWRSLRMALSQELFYVIAALMLGIGWVLSQAFASSTAISQVDAAIRSMVTAALPGEGVPVRAENTYLEAKVQELEEELRGMGSLSALSPLNSLNELVLAIGGGLDLTIESISIGHSRLLLQGTVGDNLSVATLSSALKAKADRFCEVKVDSKGKVGSRVKVSAEILLCE